MKRFLSLVAVSLLFSVSAYAEVTASQLRGAGIPAEAANIIAGIGTGGTVQANNAFLKFRNAANDADLSWAKVDSTDDTVINADSGDLIKLSVATTPIAQFGSTGWTTDLPFATSAQPQFVAATVITPSTSSVTPAAGYSLSERRHIIAAGSPTLAIVVLPVATASVGKTYSLYNQGSNPVAMVPQTGVVNVSGAMTPFICTTLKECQCSGLTTGVFGCSQQ